MMMMRATLLKFISFSEKNNSSGLGSVPESALLARVTLTLIHKKIAFPQHDTEQLH